MPCAGAGRARTPRSPACSAARRRCGAGSTVLAPRRGSCRRRAATSGPAASSMSTALASSKVPGREALVQRQVGAVLVQVLVQRPVAMRARNHAQAAVLDARLLERDPDRAVGERADRPVVAVLVPRRLVAVAGRLAEDVAAPEDRRRRRARRSRARRSRGSRARSRKARLPRTPSPLSPSTCAETSFSGRTPGLSRSSCSSAAAIAATRAAGRRKRGTTQPSSR